MTTNETPNVERAQGSGFKRELSIIPTWAIVAAALMLICIPVVLFTVVWRTPLGGPTAPIQLVISVSMGFMLGVLMLMIGYVNQDAGRRGMSRTLWTLLVIFIPNAIGFILYFLLRSPIRITCPKCEAVVDPRVNYCPRCRYSFHPTCPQCRSSVKPGDTFCANCGAQIDQVA
jgi:Double zinc ribbon